MLLSLWQVRDSWYQFDWETRSIELAERLPGKVSSQSKIANLTSKMVWASTFYSSGLSLRLATAPSVPRSPLTDISRSSIERSLDSTLELSFNKELDRDKYPQVVRSKEEVSLLHPG